MGIRIRLVAAAVTAATLTAMTGPATVSAAPASPTSSAPSGDEQADKQADKKGDKKEGADKDAVVAKVAAGLGVTVRRLVTALDNLKQALNKGTDKSAAVDAFAKELGVTRADAEKALQALSGDGPKKPGKDKQPGVPLELIKLLAAELHISADRASQVLKDLEKVEGKDVVNDPAFIAIAKKLGSTPQRLLAALVKVKQEFGGAPKEKVPGGSPTK